MKATFFPDLSCSFFKWRMSFLNTQSLKKEKLSKHQSSIITFGATIILWSENGRIPALRSSKNQLMVQIPKVRQILQKRVQK